MFAPSISATLFQNVSLVSLNPFGSKRDAFVWGSMLLLIVGGGFSFLWKIFDLGTAIGGVVGALAVGIPQQMMMARWRFTADSNNFGCLAAALLSINYVQTDVIAGKRIYRPDYPRAFRWDSNWCALYTEGGRVVLECPYLALKLIRNFVPG